MSMNPGIVFENAGLLWWLLLLLLRLLLLWARVAEALPSGRQLWSRGRAGAAWWCGKNSGMPSEPLVIELWLAQLGNGEFICGSGKGVVKLIAGLWPQT